MGQESRPVLFSILFILFVSEVVVLISYPAPLKEQLKEKSAGPGNYLSFDRPLIVLHKGASPDSGNSYDTAFWSGWGSGRMDFVLFSSYTKLSSFRKPKYER